MIFTNYLQDYKTEHEGVSLLKKYYGYAAYLVDEPNSSLALIELYVAPRYRGQNYSDKLVSEVKDIAKKSGMKRFITAVDMNSKGSRKAIRCLEAAGMKKMNEPIKIEMDLYLQEIS